MVGGSAGGNAADGGLSRRHRGHPSFYMQTLIIYKLGLNQDQSKSQHVEFNITSRYRSV